MLVQSNSAGMHVMRVGIVSPGPSSADAFVNSVGAIEVAEGGEQALDQRLYVDRRDRVEQQQLHDLVLGHRRVHALQELFLEPFAAAAVMRARISILATQEPVAGADRLRQPVGSAIAGLPCRPRLDPRGSVPGRGVRAPTFGKVRAGQEATAGSLACGLSVTRDSVSMLM